MSCFGGLEAIVKMKLAAIGIITMLVIALIVCLCASN